VCTSVEVWQLYAESRQSQDFLSSYIVQNGHSISVSGWNNEEADIYIQNDGPSPYYVVQVGATQTD